MLDADIQGAFDNINHEFLLNQIKGFPGTLWIKQWLTAGVMENQQWYPTLAGTPQGGIISPLLANIALHDMESVLGVKLNCQGYLQPDCSALVRYADDFVVFHETREGCESARNKLQHWLAQRGLTLSANKTHIRHMTEGFDFLGFHIRHYPVKNRKRPYIFLAKPSKSSVKHFRQLVKNALKRAQAWPIREVISLLNPILFEVGVITLGSVHQQRHSRHLIDGCGSSKRVLYQDVIPTKTGDGDAHVTGVKYREEKIGGCLAIRFRGVTC